MRNFMNPIARLSLFFVILMAFCNFASAGGPKNERIFNRNTFDVLNAILARHKSDESWSNPHSYSDDHQFEFRIADRSYVVETTKNNFTGPTKLKVYIWQGRKEVGDASLFGLTQTLAEDELDDIEKKLNSMPPKTYKRLSEL